MINWRKYTNIICTYIALKLGMMPEVVFVLAVIFKVGVFLLLGHQCYKLFPFDLHSYGTLFLKIVLPTLLFGVVISLFYHVFCKNDSLLKLIGFAVAFELLMIPFIWFFGFNKNERAFVLQTLKGKIISRKWYESQT